MILNEFFNLPQVFEKDMTEDQSQYTDMTVAQQVFKDNPDIDHEDDILNAAFPYVVKLVGSRKRANYMFNYDEDFPGDLISAYRYLQRDQHDVGLEEGMWDTIKKSFTPDPNWQRRAGQAAGHMAQGAVAGAAHGHPVGHAMADTGVAEGHADQQRKVFKKNGKPVGEVGIDRESSPGVGQWYMKCYVYNIDNSGYDSYEEALEELKHCLKSGVAEGIFDRFKEKPPEEYDIYLKGGYDPHTVKKYLLGKFGSRGWRVSSDSIGNVVQVNIDASLYPSELEAKVDLKNAKQGVLEGQAKIRKVVRELPGGGKSETYELLNDKGVTLKTGMSKETAQSALKAHRQKTLGESRRVLLKKILES